MRGFKKGNKFGHRFGIDPPWNKGLKLRPKHYSTYLSDKYNASRRGVEFLFTFEEWLSLWESSGHFHERGRGRGKYCMARHGDTGPYAVGNVTIKTFEENIREWVPTPIQKENHRKSLLGNKNKLGKKESDETRAKKSAAHIGMPATKGCTGMYWANNGEKEALVPKGEKPPKGFKKGRKSNFRNPRNPRA